MRPPWPHLGTLVHDEHLRLAIVDDVGDLLGVQAQVEGVGDRAGERDAEVRLEVLAVVPHQGRDAVAAADPGGDQRAGELARAADDGAVGRARELLVGAPRHDLGVGHPALGAVDDQVDGQRDVHHRVRRHRSGDRLDRLGAVGRLIIGPCVSLPVESPLP